MKYRRCLSSMSYPKSMYIASLGGTTQYVTDALLKSQPQLKLVLLHCRSPAAQFCVTHNTPPYLMMW
jgi:hypothetical protein